MVTMPCCRQTRRFNEYGSQVIRRPVQENGRIPATSEERKGTVQSFTVVRRKKAVRAAFLRARQKHGEQTSRKPTSSVSMAGVEGNMRRMRETKQ